MKAIRKALPASYCTDASRRMCLQFLKFTDLSPIRCVHTYIPISEWNEPDTGILIDAIRQQRPDMRFMVPIVVQGNTSLKHAELMDPPVLVLNSWGIPEPKVAHYADPSGADLVLVPFLAIDHTGQRIGFGKGYYDRFLASLPGHTRKIAYGYECGRIEEAIPAEATDIPVNGLVTEAGFYQFG